MKVFKNYRFQLRGVHQLQKAGESTHGHGAHLIVKLRCPIQNEGKFLLFIKEEILSRFDKASWEKSIRGEPTGENVILKIQELLAKNEQSESIQSLTLIETRKNQFVLDLSNE